MKDTLTKENFWNEMEQKYPKAMAHFKAWIDQYKTEHDWDTLFTGRAEPRNITEPALYVPKYHELPIAMQFGIFTEYVASLEKSKRSILYLKEGFLPAVREQIESAFVFMEDEL